MQYDVIQKVIEIFGYKPIKQPSISDEGSKIITFGRMKSKPRVDQEWHTIRVKIEKPEDLIPMLLGFEKNPQVFWWCLHKKGDVLVYTSNMNLKEELPEKYRCTTTYLGILLYNPIIEKIAWGEQ